MDRLDGPPEGPSVRPILPVRARETPRAPPPGAGVVGGYEHLSADEQAIWVFAFRGSSREARYCARLRSLPQPGEYRVQSYSGRIAGTHTGDELMETGIEWVLEEETGADAVILERVAVDGADRRECGQ